jgi:oligo-1,6-glucosidase
VYRSPQDDNGYDISDYEDIDPMFGTLADLDELIAALHQRGMKLVMDLVVNHTSDEHPWFQESRTARDSPTADWYIWRNPRPGFEGGTAGAEPNNWGSFFSGSAWEWVLERGQYYLHLFSRKQPDLNWENAEVRDAVFRMMRWWLDRGVDGFRMDVVNFLSKDPALPDGEVGPSGWGDGFPYFSYGPRIHDYLAEMRRKVFDARPGTYLTVGEMPGVTPEQGLRFTDEETGQVDMVFQFEHVSLDSEGSKWQHRPITVVDLKRSLARWQEALGTRGWNSLYWNNHDQPRVVSRWGNDDRFWLQSATALATVLHLHRGTPYVYQGEELGMTNVDFRDIREFRDIESLNYYDAAVNQLGLDPDTVLASMRRISRDNARTPMQWTGNGQAGFTTGRPWIEVNHNSSWLNAAAQRSDPSSVYAHYRMLIALRHSDPVVALGDFRLLLPDHPEIWAFERDHEGERIVVAANFSAEEVELVLPELKGTRFLSTNYPDEGEPLRLRPWEATIHRS